MRGLGRKLGRSIPGICLAASLRAGAVARPDAEVPVIELFLEEDHE